MNSHESNCNSSDEWHQNLLNGCDDIFHRLTHIIEILKDSPATRVPTTRRLRVFSRSEEALIPVKVEGN